MQKLKMHSSDFTTENIAKLAELFPNCVTEAGTIDGKIKAHRDNSTQLSHVKVVK